jgi:hypothetical protein
MAAEKASGIFWIAGESEARSQRSRRGSEIALLIETTYAVQNLEVIRPY